MKICLTYRISLDLLLKLVISVVAAYFVLTLNEPETFPELLKLPGFGCLWFKNTVMVLAILLLVALVHWSGGMKWMPRRAGLRIPMLLALGIVLPLLYAYVQAGWYFRSEGSSLSEIHYGTTLFPLTAAFVLLAHAYELAWYFVTKEGPGQDGETEPRTLPSIRAQQGRKIVMLDPRECACFIREDGLVQAYLADGRAFWVNKPIRALAEVLEGDLFFRTSQSAIVHRGAIKELIPGSSRTYTLLLDDVFGRSITVSQSRYAAFREWYGLR